MACEKLIFFALLIILIFDFWQSGNISHTRINLKNEIFQNKFKRSIPFMHKLINFCTVCPKYFRNSQYRLKKFVFGPVIWLWKSEKSHLFLLLHRRINWTKKKSIFQMLHYWPIYDELSSFPSLRNVFSVKIKK